MAIRKNLKLFRVKCGKTQEEMSQILCCSRATYSAIEKGTRQGRKAFWDMIQQKFAIPDREMWELTRTDEEE